MRGLFPTRLVHTLKAPCVVVMGMHRTPPQSRSARFELSRYFSAVHGTDASRTFSIKLLPAWILVGNWGAHWN